MYTWGEEEEEDSSPQAEGSRGLSLLRLDAYERLTVPIRKIWLATLELHDELAMVEVEQCLHWKPELGES